MAVYEKEIRQWTIEFSVSIIKLSKQLSSNNVNGSIINQLLRSGTSIGANVHEGKTSSTVRELTRCLTIALKSADETAYWLKVIKQAYEIDMKPLAHCESEVQQLRKVLATIIIKLKQKASDKKQTQASTIVSDITEYYIINS
jgi:four helix bundle protein